MTESLEHKKLKEMGHLVLLQRGYKSNEIHEEYRVKMPYTRKKLGYLVDIVGINKNQKTAVELGMCDAKKLTQLELFFDDVIHIPYGVEQCSKINLTELLDLKKDNNILKTVIEKLEKTIKEQKSIIDTRNRKTDWIDTKENMSYLLTCIRISLITEESLFYAVSKAQSLYQNRTHTQDRTKNHIIENVFKALFDVDTI